MRGGNLWVILLTVCMLTAVSPALGSQIDPRPTVENTIRVEQTVEDEAGAPRAFAVTGRTTTHTDVPSPVATTHVGNIDVLERERLGAPDGLPLGLEVSIAQSPIKISTIREDDFRFVVNTHGRTPGGNSYDQGLTFATDGYFWGNLQEPEPTPPFVIGCTRVCAPVVEDGEYRERSFLGAGYNLQYPEQANRTADGEVVIDRQQIDTVIWGREGDPTGTEPLEQRMDISYEVIDIAAEGGDVVAEEQQRWGPFRVQPNRYDGALSSTFYLKGISDTGLTFTYDLVRNEKGQINGYDLWLILKEDGHLPETSVGDGDITWGARLVVAMAGFEWPNTTDALPGTPAMPEPSAIPVPNFELPAGEQLPVHALTAIGDRSHTWTLDHGPLPTELTFAGPELRVSGPPGTGMEPADVNPGPKPGERVPAAYETASSPAQVPDHEGDVLAGEAPGLSGVSVEGVHLGDLGLPYLVVDGTAHPISVGEHTAHGAWVDELVRPSSTHLNAHWPVFVNDHFVDLYLFVANRPTGDEALDTSVYLYADPVFSLDSQPHDVEFVWMADTDLGNDGGDRLYRETFDPTSLARSGANFAYWLLTGEEIYPVESGFMRVAEPQETIIRQQDQNEWPIVNDTVDGVDRTVLGVIPSPILDRLHPDGDRSMFYGVRDDGASTPDPLAATLDGEPIEGGDFTLYATTAHRGVQGPALGHQVFLGLS